MSMEMKMKITLALFSNRNEAYEKIIIAIMIAWINWELHFGHNKRFVMEVWKYFIGLRFLGVQGYKYVYIYDHQFSHIYFHFDCKASKVIPSKLQIYGLWKIKEIPHKANLYIISNSFQ